jgi:hypothetical protein
LEKEEKSMTTTPTEPLDDFEVAKAVFERMKELSRERQERVLRWVAEGLGVTYQGTPQSQGQTPGFGGTPASYLQPQASTDIKTFVAAKNPRSDQQFATVVAYYYRFEAPPAQRRDAINTETVQEAARLAGRKRLTKPLNTLNNAKKQGYLDSTTRGEFSINTVGENLVAMTLPGDAEGTSSKRRPKRVGKKPRTKKTFKRG